MRKRFYTLFFVFLAAVLILVPLIPTSYFIKLGSVGFERTQFSNGVDANDQTAVNRIIREEGHYGHGDFPKFISLYSYSRYKHFGILRAAPLSSENCGIGQHCKIEVTTGMSCGGFCGGGAVFHLEKTDGEWNITYYADWVS